MKRILIALIGMMIVVCTHAQAKDSIQHIKSVEIVRERLPAYTNKANPTLFQSDIQKLGGLQVSDILKHIPGVVIKDFGGIGGLKTISVHSLGPSHTGVIVDGFVQNSAMNGQVDFSKISLNGLEKIGLNFVEDAIFPKPARVYTSYSNVSIETQMRKTSSHNRFYEGSVGVNIGSFGLLQPELSLRFFPTKGLSIALDGNIQRAKGNYPFKILNGNQQEISKRQNSESKSGQGRLRLQYQSPSSKHRWDASATLYGDDRQLPGPVILYNSYNQQNSQENQQSQQLNYRFAGNNDFVNIGLRHSRERLSFTDNPSDQDDVEGPVSKYQQSEYYLTAGYQRKLLGQLRIALSSDVVYNTMGSNMPYYVYPKRVSLFNALSVSYLKQGHSIKATLLQAYIADRSLDSLTKGGKQRWMPQLFYCFERSFAKNKSEFFGEYALRFHTKKLYREPTFNELYYTRSGNTNLKPEQVWSSNIGGQVSITSGEKQHRFMLSVDVFFNRIRDKIVAIPMSNLFEWSMQNVGLVRTIGSDVMLKAEIKLPKSSQQIYVQGQFSFQNSQDLTDPSSLFYKHQIPYTPLFSGSGLIGFQSRIGHIEYRLLWSGQRYALAENIPANVVPDFTEHSIAWRRVFQLKHIGLSASVECQNFTNNTYQVIRYYPMPGIGLRISIGLLF